MITLLHRTVRYLRNAFFNKNLYATKLTDGQDPSSSSVSFRKNMMYMYTSQKQKKLPVKAHLQKQNVSLPWSKWTTAKLLGQMVYQQSFTKLISELHLWGCLDFYFLVGMALLILPAKSKTWPQNYTFLELYASKPK